MIRAYPEEPSLRCGEDLLLRVTGAMRPFVVRLYRWTSRLEPSGEFGPYAGEAVRIPLENRRPGVYIAQCCDAGAQALAIPDARDGAALFVVRSERAKILVNLPLFTYHAYNCVVPNGDCLYTGPRSVSLHRPGGGIGAHLWDEVNPDVYDSSTPRQTFAHWDAKALAWLEENRYDAGVCCDLDLDAGRLPRGLRLLVAFGHFEYWTPPMRKTIERFLREGGNVALFTGNTAWFRVRYDSATHVLARAGKWSDDDPEERLTGTSYRFGGGCWRGQRPKTGYRVRDASHWIFAACGLRDGDEFGAEHALVGYEFDGCGDGIAPLARADAAGWNVDPQNGEVLGGRADLVLRAFGKGVVFTAGTVDWPRVMTQDRCVGQITRNVVDRLSA